MTLKNNFITPNTLFEFILLATILIAGSLQQTLAQKKGEDPVCIQSGNNSYCRGYDAEALGATFNFQLNQ